MFCPNNIVELAGLVDGGDQMLSPARSGDARGKEFIGGVTCLTDSGDRSYSDDAAD